jgi:hypothetical protein
MNNKITPIQSNYSFSNIERAVEIYNEQFKTLERDNGIDARNAANTYLEIANAQNLSSIAQSLRDIHACLS